MRDYLKDLLSGVPFSREFFRASFLEAENRVAAVRQAADRAVLPAVMSELRAQNQGGGEAVERSLADLEKGGAAVAVTGQQLGVCGGPLLTIYKIASTISLARLLERESGVRVLPLFWMQSEDHDFAEVCSTTFFGPGGELRDVALDIPADELGDSVGRLKIDPQRGGQILAWLDECHDADPEFAAVLRRSFGTAGTFSGAMARLVREIFAPYGLLVFDCDRRSIKEAYKDFIASSFLRAASIGRLLQERSAWLQREGYPLQAAIRPESPLFFVSCNGVRQRLREESDGVWVGQNVQLGKQELYRLLDQEPERFTASVLMRPVFQDTILPVGAYVAGPSEFKYLVQIRPLYDFFNCQQPLVVPRQHLAVADERTRKLMDRLEITAEEAALSPEEVILKHEKNPGFASGSFFPALEEAFLARLAQLEPDLERVDPGLKRALERTRRSIKINISRLRSRFEHAVLRREETAVQQFLRIKGALYPRSHAQERVICCAHYLLRYGRSFVEQVLAECRPLEGWKMRLLTPEHST